MIKMIYKIEFNKSALKFLKKNNKKGFGLSKAFFNSVWLKACSLLLKAKSQRLTASFKSLRSFSTSALFLAGTAFSEA